jgi:hypothetical protein
MGLKRNVSLATGLRYQGKDPMLTFVLHRIGGLGLSIVYTRAGFFRFLYFFVRCSTRLTVCESQFLIFGPILLNTNVKPSGWSGQYSFPCSVLPLLSLSVLGWQVRSRP